MQLQSTNSPFSKEQADLLNQLLPTLTDEQKAWLSGYIAATRGNVSAEVAATATKTEAVSSMLAVQENKEITILYGSQTGNCQLLAEEASSKLKAQGFEVTISSMHTYKPKELKSVSNLLVIVSTHGEGEPPDNAITFHEFLQGRKAPKMNDVRYSVLALGDSSYEFYCQTGKEFDERLEALGGTRLYSRVDCDIDFDEDAAGWIESVVESLAETSSNTNPAPAMATPVVNTAATYSRTNPFSAEILENVTLNGRGSNKETRHLELSLEGSGFEFAPGDSVGIFPENDEVLVQMLINEMDWNEEESVPVNKQGNVLTLKEALTTRFEITVLTKPLLEKASLLTTNSELKELLKKGNEDSLRNYMEGRDLLDLIKQFGPWDATVADFISILRKIPPRLYSIASSYAAEPDEVHLTVSAVRYDSHGRERAGVCSVQCAERKAPGDTLPIFIQRNENFRLPEKKETPIIMVGPGTGVAPFRSFLEEREELGIDSPAWLFFGDQHFTTDFLYQVDWQRWIKEGILTKMDVAFSRDKEEKVYVQHRMREQGKELYRWLEEGAAFYVCGDETHMAKDVHNTLLSIIEEEGGHTKEEAVSYLNTMQQQNRYLRDVY
ncbi:assimilatory sulfite reductase (NADPH) flavoprotein subunit [Bacillus sp. JCM 19041]|uniref:assimilatory sulfite reductase (NADPH) flavoprotein subunit n=1 Tax=Bacillus sp. JCM 19041 TaxID=1460637 RepID=UPI0006D0672C